MAGICLIRGHMSESFPPYVRRGWDNRVRQRHTANIQDIHSSNPKDIKKSLDVLSAPLPVAKPNGRGAGIKPQLDLRIFSASTQYWSPRTLPLSMLSAADLNISAAFLSASSLPPTESCALNASTDGIGEGLVTIVAVSMCGTCDGPEGVGAEELEAIRRVNSSFACDISPKAVLIQSIHFMR